MANELVINHPTGSTLYALLFNGTGQIYNGATFGAPDSASWTDYDIAMTEATTATGIYRASMPAAAAGVYGWVVRKQASGSPAVGDIAVGSGEIRWTGTAEETVPASANVTMHAGVAVAAADANGNIPVVLYGTQPAVEFGQVKITTNVASQGALHIRNNNALGRGIDVYSYLAAKLEGSDRGVQLQGGSNQALFLLSDTAAATVYIEGPTTGGKAIAISSPSDGSSGANASGIYIETQGGHPGILFAFSDPADALSVINSNQGNWTLDELLTDVLEDTSTTLPGLISDLPTASEIDTELSSTHGGGSWEGGGSGSYAGDGTGYYTDTIDDGTSPLDGVRVQLYTAQNRVGPAYEAYTNALGVFEMWPDPGTYYRWLDYAGVSFAQDVAVVVTEP